MATPRGDIASMRKPPGRRAITCSRALICPPGPEYSMMARVCKEVSRRPRSANEIVPGGGWGVTVASGPCRRAHPCSADSAKPKVAARTAQYGRLMEGVLLDIAQRRQLGLEPLDLV